MGFFFIFRLAEQEEDFGLKSINRFFSLPIIFVLFHPKPKVRRSTNATMTTTTATTTTTTATTTTTTKMTMTATTTTKVAAAKNFENCRLEIFVDGGFDDG